MKENQRAYDFPAEGSRPHAAEADELTWLVKAEIKALYQPQLLSEPCARLGLSDDFVFNSSGNLSGLEKTAQASVVHWDHSSLVS